MNLPPTRATIFANMQKKKPKPTILTPFQKRLFTLEYLGKN